MTWHLGSSSLISW